MLQIIFRFCLVGTAGFVIDASIVQVLVAGLHVNPYLARAVSILTAATATWLMNRRFTFQVTYSASRREWSRYVGLMMFGASVNYAVFAFCIAFWQTFRAQPVLAVAVGSIVGLLVNFTTSRIWVFNSARNI